MNDKIWFTAKCNKCGQDNFSQQERKIPRFTIDCKCGCSLHCTTKHEEVVHVKSVGGLLGPNKNDDCINSIVCSGVSYNYEHIDGSGCPPKLQLRTYHPNIMVSG